MAWLLERVEPVILLQSNYHIGVISQLSRACLAPLPRGSVVLRYGLG